jgi:hypothetical protein
MRMFQCLGLVTDHSRGILSGGPDRLCNWRSRLEELAVPQTERLQQLALGEVRFLPTCMCKSRTQ